MNATQRKAAQFASDLRRNVPVSRSKMMDLFYNSVRREDTESLTDELIAGGVRFLDKLMPEMPYRVSFVTSPDNGILIDQTFGPVITKLLHDNPALVFEASIHYFVCVACQVSSYGRLSYLPPCSKGGDGSQRPRLRFDTSQEGVIYRIADYAPWTLPSRIYIAGLCFNCNFKCQTCGWQITPQFDIPNSADVLLHGECSQCAGTLHLTNVEPPKLGRRDLRTVVEKARKEV